MIPEGKYKVRGVEAALCEVGANATEAVQVIVEIQDGEHKGERYRWDGWLNNEANAQRSMESLRHLGWETDRLDDLRGITTKDAIAVIAHEDGEDGKTYVRVRWINGQGAGIKEEQKVSSVAAKALADRFAAMARGTRPKTASSNGSKPATKPAGPPKDFGDDDIPF